MKQETDRLIGDVVRKSVQSWITGIDAEDPEKKAVSEYRRYAARKWIFLAVCLVALIVMCGVALTIGQYSIGFKESYRILLQHISGDIEDKLKDYVIWDLRLPKIVVGIIAGAGLSISGVTMQSILKNPLADPYTTGVSSGAGFGATLSIVMGANVVANEYALVLNAFIFALIPTIVILLVSKIKNSSPTTMIMAGIAIMFIFNALTTIIKLWGDPNALGAILEWQIGSIGGIEWKNIPVMLAVVITGYLIIHLISRKLNILATGEDNAKALG